MKVLAVDDNDDIRLLVTTVLTMHGFEVIEARDGAETLEILRSADPPDLVLLDIRIPAPDGLEVLDVIRAEAMAVKVVIFSAHADDATERDALQRGADAFVVKPFTPNVLSQTVERLTGTRS